MGDPMWSSDSGKGRLKLIIALLAIAGLAYFTVEAIPVYVHAYELQDYMRHLVYQVMAGQRHTAEAVRNNLLSKAAELQLPVKAEDVKIEMSMRKVTINVDYEVPVDLGISHVSLHFTPSAENTSLY